MTIHITVSDHELANKISGLLTRPDASDALDYVLSQPEGGPSCGCGGNHWSCDWDADFPDPNDSDPERPRSPDPNDSDPERPRFPDAHVQLSGQDGSAVVIIGRTMAALRKAGATPAELDEFSAEAMSGDYDHVIRTAMDWADVS